MEMQPKTIKERIEESGLKMLWIANKIGIPQSTLSHYINGTRTMPDEINNKIVELIKK